MDMTAGFTWQHRCNRVLALVAGVILITCAGCRTDTYTHSRFRERSARLTTVALMPAQIRTGIRGDLHCHTTDSDGKDDLEAMAMAARERGYEYLAISDHSKRVAMARGLDAKRLGQQIRRIDRLNERLEGIRLLKAAEVDILENGSLDLPNDILKELDFTVCSVHYHLNLPAEKQTERILRAMENPYFRILGHPTGRLINARPPFGFDLEKIMKSASERGRILEVNSQPDRLDLSDVHCKMAKEHGVRLAISTDAHQTSELDFMRFGIAQARRGWIEAKDVINTKSLEDLLVCFSAGQRRTKEDQLFFEVVT